MTILDTEKAVQAELKEDAIQVTVHAKSIWKSTELYVVALLALIAGAAADHYLRR